MARGNGLPPAASTRCMSTPLPRRGPVPTGRASPWALVWGFPGCPHPAFPSARCSAERGRATGNGRKATGRGKSVGKRPLRNKDISRTLCCLSFLSSAPNAGRNSGPLLYLPSTGRWGRSGLAFIFSISLVCDGVAIGRPSVCAMSAIILTKSPWFGDPNRE